MGSADQLLERLTDVPLSTYDHRQRRAEELHWVRTQGQAASLLEAYDEVRAARTAGVTVGPGMGSTHASLLLWCMGLTEFDPVVWSLPPSTFYRIGPRVHHARWYVSASPRQSGHLQFDPLVAALARQQATPEERTPLRENVTGGPWSFTRYPSARWILALAPAPSFDDRVCAAALARPGPAGCGMLQTYLSRPWQSRGTLLPHILSVSRGVLLFREQVHAMGSALLGLNLISTASFARDLTVGSHHKWRMPLRDAFEANGASQGEAEALQRACTRWSPFLASRAHGIGRAQLAARCVKRGIHIENS